MIPWELLDKVQVPGSGVEMTLYRRGAEFSIRVDRCELMNSRVYGSEDALSDLACDRIAGRPRPCILIGGLGMGFTLASALRRLKGDARVIMAELVPAVVKWNRGPLSALAGHPLQDKRVTVRVDDVGRIIREKPAAYDAILLDVDNGPVGLTRKDNNWLYAPDGLAASFAALRPGGVLAVWSAGPERVFNQRLRQAGFEMEEVHVRARGAKGGSHHTIWLAKRPC